MYRKVSEYLKQWKESPYRKPLLLQGARQVGKSTLLKHVFPDYHRANFDDKLTRMQAREEPKLFFMNNDLYCPANEASSKDNHSATVFFRYSF